MRGMSPTARALIVAISLLLCPYEASADITLVRDGKSDYVIVLADDATAAERRGASELSSYIKQMSGAELPVVARSDSEHAIRISRDANLRIEAFTLRTDGQQLLITGGGPRGAMYGCTALLE